MLDTRFLIGRGVDPKQSSRAYVFDGASGIGKTFGALRLASDMPENFPESASPIRDYQLDVAYVGFNCHAPISGTEEVALEASVANDKAKTAAMRRLVYTRLSLILCKPIHPT